MLKKKKHIEYRFNPELVTVKNNWKGNITIEGKFYNDPTPVKSPIVDVFKWKLSTNPQKEEKKNDTFKLSVVPLLKVDKTKDQIIWLGHASFLIVINGKMILTDPCFNDIPSIKRLADLPCKTEVLNNIDYLLLSHDHRDHFDVKSIKDIVKRNPNVTILTSLNFEQLLTKNDISPQEIQEAGWYQKYNISPEIEITFLPSHHWGRRGLTDFNKVLWGGFLIKSNDRSIYFSGDTAYSPVFKEIQKTFGDFDICLLPIGAYSPSFIMSQSHVTPEEAFRIFRDLKGKTLIPMHFGTYDLSDEPLGEPIRRLHSCFEGEKEGLMELKVGELFFMGYS